MNLIQHLMGVRKIARNTKLSSNPPPRALHSRLRLHQRRDNHPDHYCTAGVYWAGEHAPCFVSLYPSFPDLLSLSLLVLSLRSLYFCLAGRNTDDELGGNRYVFGPSGVINGTSLDDGAHRWNTGLAFLFGLLSVQWTMTDYDATAHISCVLPFPLPLPFHSFPSFRSRC